MDKIDLRKRVLTKNSNMAEPFDTTDFIKMLCVKIEKCPDLKVYHLMDIQDHFNEKPTVGKSELKISKLYFKAEVILGQQVSSDEQQRKKEVKRSVCTEAEQLIEIVSDSGESGEDYTEFPLTDDQRKRFSDALKSDLLHRYNYVGGPYCTFKSIEEVRVDAREIIKILPLGRKARAELGFAGKRDY